MLQGFLGLCLLILSGLAPFVHAQTPQTLTWLSPTNEALILGQPYPLSAMASSGLPVAFRVQAGPARISGGSVTATNIGTIRLVAEQAGDASHAPTSVTRVYNRTEFLVTRLGGSGFMEGHALSVRIAGNLAYTAVAGTGLEIMDLSDPTHPVRVGGYSGQTYRVEILGPLAYVAGGQDGLQILDVSNPALPVRLGGYDTAGSSSAVRVKGHIAYVADNEAGLQIIDVSDPVHPVRLGGYATGDLAYNLDVAGNLAYVVSGTGLQIIDVSSPVNPAFIGRYQTERAAVHVQVVGARAYVAEADRGLRILDVSNPAVPTLMGSFPASDIRSTQVLGDLAYLSIFNGFQILDLSDPANPSLIGGYLNSPNGSDVQVQGDLVCLADYFAGLQVLELRQGMTQSIAFDPPETLLVTNSPVLLQLKATASSGLPVKFTVLSGPAQISDNELSITNDGSITVRAEQPGNLQFLPVSTERVIQGFRYGQQLEFTVPGLVALTNPVVTLSATASSGLPVTFDLLYGPAILEGNQLTATNAGSVTVQARQAGNAIYAPASLERQIVFSSSGQKILWSGPTNAVLALGKPYPVTVSASSGLPVTYRIVSGPAVLENGSLIATNVGKISVVAAQGIDASLERVFNAFDQLPLQQVVGIGSDNQTYRVQVVGNLVYLADGYSGLQIIDFANPAHPVRVGTSYTGGNVVEVQVVGTLAYVSKQSGGWEIIDVSNPASPVPVAQPSAPASVSEVCVVDGIACLAAGFDGVQIYDVHNPAQPRLLGGYDALRFADCLQRVGSLIYVGYGSGEMLVLDVTDPARPVRVGGTHVSAPVTAIQIEGNRAYITAGYSGLNTVDVSDPASPVLLGTYATSERALDLQVRGGVVYMAQDSLLQILDMSNPLQPVLVGGIPFFERNHFQSVQVVGSRIFASGDREVKIFQNLLPRQILLSTPTPPGTELFLYPEVIGLGAATFQWYFGDLPLPGETNEFLHLPEVTSATAGTYTLEVTSAGYTGRNDPVTVYLPPPVILQPPADLALIAGLSNVLSVTAGGLPELQYQWRHEGISLAGQTNPVLPLTVTNRSALGGYDVIVSNGYGATTSRLAQVTQVADVAGFFVELNTVKSLPDGRVLLDGIYTNATTLYGHLLVRLLPDLSQDLTFQAYDPGQTVTLSRIAAAPDGRLVLLGTSGAAQFRYLSRLNPDGSKDNGMVSLLGSIAPASAPTDLAFDGSGRLLVTGNLTTGGAENRPLVRLLPDGSRDPVFAANLSVSQVGSGGRAVVEQPDGRLILAGSFRNSAGVTNRGGIVRLNPDGTPDETFATGAGFDSGPALLAVDNRGRVLAAGTYSQFGGQPARNLVRLNPDGSRDASFVPAISGTSVIQLAAAPNGGIVIRLADGTVQLLAETGALLKGYGTSSTPFAVEPAGSILIAQGHPSRLVRLAPSEPLIPEAEFEWGTLTVQEADSVVQMPVRRTGAVSAPAQVTYHVRAGTAVAGMDFIETDGVIQFDAGVTEANLTFPLSAQNGRPNDDRTIRVELGSLNGTGGPADRATCVVTIEDDDVGLTAELFASQTTPLFAPDALATPKAYYLRKLEQHRDAQVFFEWDGTAPRGATNDFFALIWTGLIVPEVTGQYQFATLADDGARIWLDDRLIVSNWTAVTFKTTKSGPVQLEAGKPYRLVVNYFEQSGQATCRLLWSLPGTNVLTPVPRRVLRPGTPEFTPPSIAGNASQITFSTEAGRPVNVQTSINGKDWKFVLEAVSSVGGVTNSFNTFGLDVRNVALIRAVSLDGLMVTNALAPLIRVNGLTDGGDFSLFANEANSLTFSVPVYEGIGQSIAWFRDGEPVGVGSPLIVSGLDARPAGKYQAVVTYPFGQVRSNVRGVNLIEVLLPSVSTERVAPDGSFHIHVVGSPTHPERYVRVEVSTDLQHWETVQFNLGAFDVALPLSNGPAQFFRAVVE